MNDLGVIHDSKLSFDCHRTIIISKDNRQLGFISKFGRDFKDPYCFKSLYCALLRPILESANLVWMPHQLYWSIRLEHVQRRFIRIALRDLPWRQPDNLPAYADRCRLLNLDTLERRRKVQQVLFVAKLLNNEVDSPKLLSLINFRAPQRALRPSSLLINHSHRTNFGHNEPVASCINMFSRIEGHFEFGEPSQKLKKMLDRISF